MISWFNNSVVMSFLLAPISKLRFFRGIQRLRICEHCAKMGIDMHWSKTDHIVDGEMKYTHIYLCDTCFYNEKFAHKFKDRCVIRCWPYMRQTK